MFDHDVCGLVRAKLLNM